MKSDLILLRYKTIDNIGTKTSLEPKTFFGSKMVDVEDSIYFDNSEVQYSEVRDVSNNKNNGYQYLVKNILEKTTLINLDDVKSKYSTISLVSQTEADMEKNTQWSINIDWVNILSDYLFYRLKEARTFKCIKYSDVISENINYYVYDYIKNNILNRYAVDNIEFFVKYYSLDEGDEETTEPNLRFMPLFNDGITSTENLVKNINSNITQTNIEIKYKQIMDSKYNKFDYYYNLNLIKI